MMKGIVILGSGGHAKVVIDILLSQGETIAGFVDPGGAATEVLGFPRLGSDQDLPALRSAGFDVAFVALGTNQIRLAKLIEVQTAGFRLANAISPRAAVSSFAIVGNGVAIMPGAVVNAGSRLGDGVIVNTNASVDHDCEVGECAHIAPRAALAGNVQIGKGAFLGIGSSVIPGRRIGDWALVGAGAAVITDIPSDAVAVGVPARVRPGH
jgi:UDP-perosamine 4-acetyltransferase